MAKMKMPKMGGKPADKPHVRMRKLKAVAPSAFPPAPMAFPPSADPSAGGGAPAMPGQDPTQAMAAPPTAGPPSGGMMGQ